MGHKLTVRNCHPQDPRDAAAYEQLKEGAVFAHLLSRPDYRVEENLFFVEMAGVIVGFVNVLPELGIGRVIFECGVSSSYKSEVVLKELFDRAMKRARELGAKVAHVSIPATQSMQAQLLSNLGFKVVRRFYELRLDVFSVNLEAVEQSDMESRHLKVGEEALFAWIENRCFIDTWGFNPNTAEYIGWELSTRGDCTDDVILALSEGKPIGYCWNEAECGRDSATGKKKGRIYMLGVDTDCRGKGLGKELLRAGLLHLRGKGRELIDITVDSQNIVAVTLYRSLGFQLYGETMWYEKVVP
ncbi:MAG: GNAT family N-acetyltransferase [Chloroflexi bacterium]|nr:GNAT family N-acetyltransferase [Chloroflexota bacterium]